MGRFSFSDFPPMAAQTTEIQCRIGREYPPGSFTRVEDFDGVHEIFFPTSDNMGHVWVAAGLPDVPAPDSPFRDGMPKSWVRALKKPMKFFATATEARAWLETLTPEERARRCAPGFNDKAADEFWESRGYRWIEERQMYVKQ
jgi:hypothetical protein